MKDKFKYVVISVVLLIPFIYSFFYLKAYWDPYGEGNIDNIPVALVNEDKGDKGDKLVKSIKDSKKLKLNIVDEEEAEDGLYEGKYYAFIKIPKDFTENMESASKTNKKHATITYSPNQKANFLASQIINSVVNAVEKNLDNEINSAITKELSKKIEEVPEKLDKISSGFKDLKEATDKLNEGSKSLKEGTNTLNTKYNEFNSGVYTINNGVLKLQDGSDKLTNGIKSAADGSNQIKSVLDNKISELQNDNSEALTEQELEGIGQLAEATTSSNETLIKSAAIEEISKNPTYQKIVSGINAIQTNYINNGITTKELCSVLQEPTSVENCKEYLTKYPYLIEEKTIMEEVAKNVAFSSAKQISKQTAKEVAKTVANQAKEKAKSTSVESLSQLSQNIGNLNNGLNTLYNGSNELSSGIHSLYSGSNILYNGSMQINSGINTLNIGTQTLSSGISTLNASVKEAKDELDKNIAKTKDSIKPVKGLSEYSKEPVKINTKVVNKVKSYGTSFSPLFMSIGLWVGSLMMFVVLYYDKEERFGILGINSKKYAKQILTYHGLITISSLVLGMLLHMFLDLDITNIPLYYITLVLTGNTFMGIIEFLIICFKDVGKFIALIILVLQLAASGGTFPVETVAKSFRWMNPFLPMTYTVNLLRESLIKIERPLLTKNLIIVILTCIIFFIVNIIMAKLKEQKENID